MTQEEIDQKLKKAADDAVNAALARLNLPNLQGGQIAQAAQTGTFAAISRADDLTDNVISEQEQKIQEFMNNRCVTPDCPFQRVLGLKLCSPCGRRVRQAPIRKQLREINAKRRVEERKEKDRLESIAFARIAAQLDARLDQ